MYLKVKIGVINLRNSNLDLKRQCEFNLKVLLTNSYIYQYFIRL